METRGRLRSEPEIEHLEGDGTEAANIDDEEVEELHNSLKEVVQDPFVKPKLQCLMVDPSFSMVTVQSEDSGIVWETASSRCSTPWASEASSPSDVYSMEGSGTQGNIVIIMDEDKIKRRKKTSKGKLGDRFRRRLSGAAIGEERPAMVEVSVPNVRPETSEDGQSSESKTDKDQELFNLISEGFEILNIVVPSKLPTVDEEESTDLTDNLSYLEDSPKIKSKCKQTETTDTLISSEDVVTDSQETTDEGQKDPSQTPAGQPKKDETELDYLEKFTLLDVNAPCEVSDKPEPVQVAPEEEPQVAQEEEKVEEKLDEDSFVIISDVEIAGEHLDEVFYGARCHEEPEMMSHHKEDGKHLERQSSKTLKECGSTLFGSQECILTPVYLPSGPPKIIDQNLLDEPRALSFHYSDLYEDAVGDRKKEDDFSDAESVISEKSFKRRFSESDDDGYLEKFILKDDTPAVEDAPDEDPTESDRIIWPQSKFEMTGCLVRVKEENELKQEDVCVSQSELEGKQEDVKKQIQPPDSSEDCEHSDGMKTGCVTGESVSEALEDCGDCGTETGCAVAKIIPSEQLAQELEAGDQEKKKSVLVKAEAKHESSHVTDGVVQERKKTEVKAVRPKEVLHEKTDITSSVAKETEFQDGLKGVPNDITDSTVEIEETIIIKKEKISKDKGKGQEHKKTQDTPDLVVEADVKPSSVSTTTDEKEPMLPQEDVLQKDLPIVKKDISGIALVPKISEVEKTKPSDEKAGVPERECEVDVTAALLTGKSNQVIEKLQEPAQVEKGVRVESEKQEKNAGKTMVSDVDGHIKTKSEAKDAEVSSELETIGEQKASGELLATDTSANKMDESKVVVTEKTKLEIESMEDKAVPTMDSKVPDRESVTVTPSLNDVTQIEKHVLVEEPRRVEKEFGLKHELPKGGRREVDGGDVSIGALPKEIPVALPTVPEVPQEDLLPTVVLPPVLDEKVGKKEKLADAVLKETHAETKKEESESILLLPVAETEDSSSIKVSTPVPNEVVHKQAGSEIRGDIAVDISLKESVGQVPQPVHPAAAAAEDDASEMPAQEEEEEESKNEIKSRKVLLKDTHKENRWRTLEPIMPSPPVEIQDSSTMRVSPLELPEYIQEEDEEFVIDGKLKRDTGLFSALRSFSPLEDLSGFGRDTAELDLNKEPVEEPDYEIVSKQEARQSELEAVVGTQHQELGFVHDKSAEEARLEASYEFIEDLDDAQTSELGRLIEDAEIQPMDAFCLVCRCPILMSDGGHQTHEVSSLDKAFEDIKSQLSNWISVLQERAENIEDMVSELELAYNSVEEHCKDSEKAMDEQNEEMLKLVMDQYNEMSQTMEDEKKVKLEQLYDQIVSFQANIDSAKETMEKTTKEMEETDELAFASSYKDIDTRLKTALESTMSLELGPRGLLVFEDYAKGTTANEKKNRQVIPVPQQPHLQPQEANSATSTSVTVYWTINEGDIIDCFQVYCMEEPQGAVSEEYRVTVKESYCNLEELEPDKCYKVWVMAVNYTGCSLPSERLPFRTAPSVPVINPEACTVVWDSATLRWSSAQPSAVDSFTLEYCRQYAMEGEGLRSMSGIKGYEHKVLLQPNENFLFYIKSVNAAGASEQSEAALISTRGTRFYLLRETANAVLKVSEDRNFVEYPLETYNEMSSLIECPAVMGELLPRVGYHYWETVVSGCKAYRIGVAYQTAPIDSTVGDNSASWCLHCVPTSISCRFELLHDNVESDIFVMDVPHCIGTLLDFTQGRLVFFNAQNGQCLGSFQQSFTQPCHPVFVLETAGRLELKMTMEVPEFAKHW
ncbi:cardiomyopathy-associated protein 5 [Salminus brasiliensis]|uniref:cardiomyopathy-associated protein 5 n=1 Tax=Salminus brasiliensis TaxID=930266 RepID=UPI003B8365F2